MSRAVTLANPRSDGDEPIFGEPLEEKCAASTCLLDIDLGLALLGKEDLMVEVSEIRLWWSGLLLLSLLASAAESTKSGFKSSKR
jgi:hypothetical protein